MFLKFDVRLGPLVTGDEIISQRIAFFQFARISEQNMAFVLRHA